MLGMEPDRVIAAPRPLEDRASRQYNAIMHFVRFPNGLMVLMEMEGEN